MNTSTLQRLVHAKFLLKFLCAILLQNSNYPFKTSKDTQGCDGKKAKKSEYKGIMYKQKRYGRKMLKAIFKIARRKPANQKKLAKEQN